MGGVRVSHRWLRRNALITAPRLATAAPNMNTRRVNETPLRAAPIRNQRVVPAAYPNQNGKQFEPPRPLIGHFSLPARLFQLSAQQPAVQADEPHSEEAANPKESAASSVNPKRVGEDRWRVPAYASLVADEAEIPVRVVLEGDVPAGCVALRQVTATGQQLACFE